MNLVDPKQGASLTAGRKAPQRKRAANHLAANDNSALDLRASAKVRPDLRRNHPDDTSRTPS